MATAKTVITKIQLHVAVVRFSVSRDVLPPNSTRCMRHPGFQNEENFTKNFYYLVRIMPPADHSYRYSLLAPDCLVAVK